MLTDLSISNVAVIKSLNINLLLGLTALTGETGAGKSIIIDSINMVLGERTNKDIVRFGEKKATVQAVFETNDKLCAILEEHGIDTEDGQVIITREINAEGKSVCRINGTMITLAQLRTLAPLLVNIHGQHDNQSLLNPKKHIDFIDAYGKTFEELDAYKKEYEKRHDIITEIERLTADENERLRRIDILKYQINEIDSARLTPGEEEDLTEQRNIAVNSEKITNATRGAYELLYGGENSSAYDSLSSAVSLLSSISDYMPEAKRIYEQLESALYTIEDASHSVSEIMNGTEFDEQALNDIEYRLDTISKLKRKYGSSIPEILDFCESARTELEAIESSDERREELAHELKISEEHLTKLANALSKKRKAGAISLQNCIRESLSELDMGRAEFEVSFSDCDGFTPNGTDKVEFMISTNAGEPVKELSSVASGGELSRVMLAMKSVLADADGVDTMIFDEIDTGVSGAAAQKIAKKLEFLSRNRQVICITHLPQIASMADDHLFISKSVHDDKTETIIKRLSESERINEISRITDGVETEASLSHAREMLDRAKALKQY